MQEKLAYITGHPVVKEAFDQFIRLRLFISGFNDSGSAERFTEKFKESFRDAAGKAEKDWL